MADDDLVLNFEVGDTPGANLVSTQYKGRWKERALSKKWDKIKARRVLAKSTIPTTIPTIQVSVVKTTNGVTGGVEKDKTLKRKRKQAVASSSNAMPVASRNFGSSSLFTSNPEITSTSHKEPKAAKAPRESPIPAESSASPPATTLISAPSQVTEFTSLGINPTICSHLERSLQITKPTQIQTLAIPHLVTSPYHDTFLRAQTGSGKTLSFLLPILHHILSHPPPANTTAPRASSPSSSSPPANSQNKPNMSSPPSLPGPGLCLGGCWVVRRRSGKRRGYGGE
jgi:ATP-dependent RNA helicase DDX31/DBP7